MPPGHEASKDTEVHARGSDEKGGMRTVGDEKGGDEKGCGEKGVMRRG